MSSASRVLLSSWLTPSVSPGSWSDRRKRSEVTRKRSANMRTFLDRADDTEMVTRCAGNPAQRVGSGPPLFPLRPPGQRLEPDVAVAHLAAVVLEPDRAGAANVVIGGPARDAVELAVLDDGDAIEDHGDQAFLGHVTVVRDTGGMKVDVVGLPLLGW